MPEALFFTLNWFNSVDFPTIWIRLPLRQRPLYRLVTRVLWLIGRRLNSQWFTLKLERTEVNVQLSWSWGWNRRSLNWRWDDWKRNCTMWHHWQDIWPLGILFSFRHVSLSDQQLFVCAGIFMNMFHIVQEARQRLKHSEERVETQHRIACWTKFLKRMRFFQSRNLGRQKFSETLGIAKTTDPLMTTFGSQCASKAMYSWWQMRVASKQ